MALLLPAHTPLPHRRPLRHRGEREGVRFAVVHETGGKTGRERRAAAEYPDDDVLVFGHSHIPWDTTTTNRRGGLRPLNPGSPTDRRRMPTATYLTATVHNGRLGEVELHHRPGRT